MIRKAAVDDAAAIRALRLDALQSHPDSFGSDYEGEVAYPLSRWKERLDDSARGAIYVAESSSALIGMAGIYHSEKVKLRHIGTIWGIYVRPASRGNGIARELIESCLGWARQRRLRAVKLAVVSTNVHAIRTYAQSGFRVYGVDPEALCHDGVFYDELLMVIEIQRGDRDRNK